MTCLCAIRLSKDIHVTSCVLHIALQQSASRMVRKFSCADGKGLIASSSLDRTVLIFDPVAAEPLMKLVRPQLCSVHSLLSVLVSGKRRLPFRKLCPHSVQEGHTEAVCSVVFCTNGSLLTSSWDQ